MLMCTLDYVRLQMYPAFMQRIFANSLSAKCLNIFNLHFLFFTPTVMPLNQRYVRNLTMQILFYMKLHCSQIYEA